jgi:hypothetical protein
MGMNLDFRLHYNFFMFISIYVSIKCSRATYVFTDLEAVNFLPGRTGCRGLRKKKGSTRGKKSDTRAN